MQLRYNYRLYPAPRQRQALARAFGCARVDLTARDYGGYQTVLATHAEGSLEAEKLQIRRSYDPARARLAVADILDAAR